MNVVPNVVYDPSQQEKVDEKGNLIKGEPLDAPMGICYEDLIPVLIKAIQEQQSLIESQFDEIEDLKKKISNTENLKSGEIGAENNFESSASLNSNASLFQNKPNPFSELTTITYTLPEDYIYSKLIIFDDNGSKMLEYNLSEKGVGSKIIPAKTLNTGIYIYSLIVDGKIIDTKKMIIN